MRYLSTALSALALLASASLAAAADEKAKVSDPTRIIEAVTIEDLVAVLRDIGAKEIEIYENEGTKGIIFSDRGVPYGITLAVCEENAGGKCLGYGILTLIDDAGYSYDKLNQWNKDTMLVTLFKDEGNKSGIARVELTDGGVTRQHVADTIVWMVTDVLELMKSAGSQITTDAAKPDGFKQTTGLQPQALSPVKATPQQLLRAAKQLTRLRGKLEGKSK